MRFLFGSEWTPIIKIKEKLIVRSFRQDVALKHLVDGKGFVPSRDINPYKNIKPCIAI